MSDNRTAIVAGFFARNIQPDLEPILENAMEREIDQILVAVPLEELAVQWDVCTEVVAGVWRGRFVMPWEWRRRKK